MAFARHLLYALPWLCIAAAPASVLAQIPVYEGPEPDAVPDRYREGSPVEMPAFAAEVILLPAGMMASFGGHSAMRARAAERGERVTTQPVPESDHFQLITPDHPTWQPVRAAILKALGVRRP